MNDRLWLMYKFNGWKFEFEEDYILITNLVNKNVYKIQLEPYSDIPFLITLIEKGIWS